MSDSNWDEEFHDSVESIRKTRCDVCGKEVDKVFTHNLVNNSGHLSICPECYEECIQPKMPDTKYLDAFEKGRVFERDKQKEDLLKAVKGIKEELHDLNRSLKRR